MNLLQLVQQATAEMGLTQPSTVVGNTSVDTIQQLALLNAAGMEIVRENIWQGLDKEYRFTTQSVTTTGTVTLGSPVITGIPSTAGLDSTYQLSANGVNQDTYILSVDSATQVTMTQPSTAAGVGVAMVFGKTQYALPSDYDRQIDRTHYDKSKRWEMIGPETPQQWQFLKSAYISTGPRIRYRILANKFQIWPIIGTPEYLGYEYISNAWVTSASGVSKTLFSADTDTCMFSDRLMILALKKKYFQVKGFDAGAYTVDYMAELDRAKADEAGSATLSMAPRLSQVLIGFDQIPDAGYGS